MKQLGYGVFFVILEKVFTHETAQLVAVPKIIPRTGKVFLALFTALLPYHIPENAKFTYRLC